MVWGGRLFEAGHLLTFSSTRMGAYSGWALIRGWVLIRINTVFICLFTLNASSAATAINFRENTVQYHHTLTQFPKFLCLSDCFFICFIMSNNASTPRQLCY